MSDAADDLNYPDDLIRKILSRSRVIALVGASANWNRPSYFVMKYLQGKGYRVIPVNPGLAGQTLLGEIVRPDLASVDAPIDIVEIFRRSQFAGAIVDEAIAVGAKTIWMQLGVRDDAAAERARAAGLDVVMNRCLKIEYGRLGGELAWSGVNTGVISSRAPTPPTRKPLREREASAKTDHGFETKAIHAGAMPDASTGARITPIYQTSSYVFEDAEHAASLFNLHNFGHVYTRLSNPTVAVLEERIAALEGGRAAVAAASGHAAQFLTFFTLLEPGDEFIASRNLYGGSLTQFGDEFSQTRLDLPFRRSERPGKFQARADRAHQGDLHREPRQSRRRGGGYRGHRAHRRRRSAFRSSSTIRWRRPISAARSNGAPTSSVTRRRNSSPGTAIRWAGRWWSRASSIMRPAANSLRSRGRSRPITGSIFSRPSAISPSR